MAKNEVMEDSVQSIAQRLDSIIKSCRKIMRKDKGLSSDIDRLPMLTTFMFLKFLDDHERIREAKATPSNPFKPWVKSPYRWRDWASARSSPNGPRLHLITGDDLLKFVHDEEFKLPDGMTRPGLFAYLKNLKGENGRDQRDVIAAIFGDFHYRMTSGHLLREMLNRLDGIDFANTSEIDSLSHIYETMLRQMRDAAGSAGEFYTPRPLVKFIVGIASPKLGEKVLDPACGTGGFLVEAFFHLRNQVRNTSDLESLQKGSIFGGEAKPLPYLLCQMNLLLHGMDYPSVDYGDSLRFPLREIGDKDRVDTVVTNPPFGGEEEPGILSNFPIDRRINETAFLFLQLIMRKLKKPSGGYKGGRAFVIAPDGVLSATGMGERIKQDLVEGFNLHSIIRLPEGVFSPYTDIPTNVLCFNNDGKSKGDIWYYELPLPKARKKYTKTMPLRYEEFEECIGLWDARTEGQNSWIVSYDSIKKNSYNLDVKNPSNRFVYESIEPTDVIHGISAQIGALNERLERFKVELTELRSDLHKSHFTVRKVSSFAKQHRRAERIEPGKDYVFLGVSSECKGLFEKKEKTGEEIRASYGYKVKKGDFVYSRLFARYGSFAVAVGEHDGCYVSGEFPTFELDQSIVSPEYLILYFSLPSVWRYVESKSQGTTKASRFRFKEEFFLDMHVPTPDRKMQDRIVEVLDHLRELSKIENTISREHEGLILSSLSRIFKEYLDFDNS